MHKKQTRLGSTKLVVIILVVVILLGIIGFFIWQNFLKPKQAADGVKTVTTSNSKSVTDDTTPVATGFIEGSFTYPSEGIPEEIVVYAKNLDTGKEYSTSNHVSSSSFQNGVGYKIEVPVGNYNLYGLLSNNRAYYDQFIVCGMSVDCKDFSKISVKVTDGGTASDITIGDWWNPVQN